MYIHVITENAEREVEATSHPVESGIPLTDTVNAKALSISLSGKIVDYGDMKASQVIDQLKKWHETGGLIEYHGRNTASSMQIRSFSTDQSHTIHGGADFHMTLEQIRIAGSSYDPKKSSTEEKEEAAKKNPVIEVGSTVVFTGGAVYRSSDAKKAAATRGRSTCKVTIISTAHYSVHQYHLISEDGGKVYGWVDGSQIEGAAATSTSGKTNGGTQQTKSKSKSSGSKSTGTTSAKETGNPIYHKVKPGDTVYSLVKQYGLGKPVSWVVQNSTGAFTSHRDASTLKVGAYLLMGYK